MWYRDHGLAAACNIGPTWSTVVTILKSLGHFAGGSFVFAKRPPSKPPDIASAIPAPLKEQTLAIENAPPRTDSGSQSSG